ncbi:MAG: PIN domain-containing protein [Coriobacteriia bacterium]|nr:PIN domain-containing protein [Coriobacteriia bacterium]
MSAVLVDANVLVYAADRLAGARHHAARHLLACLDHTNAAVSSQVLSEYANVLTHPRKLAREAPTVARSVREVAVRFRVIPVTAETVLEAVDARARWQLAYYDAQIWAAAALAGVPVVLSEDFADGLVLGPVRFVNPFAEGFVLAEVLM